MSDDGDQAARLKAALARLANPEETRIPDPAPEGEGQSVRQIGAKDRVGVLAAALSEIGDTVLPAKIVLSGAGGQVSLAAASRRVQGLLAASDALLEDGDAGLVEALLDAEEAAPITQLGAVLARLVQAGGPFGLRSEIAPRLGAESEPGVSIGLLTEMWDLAAADPNAPPLELFLKSADAVIRGGIVQRSGEVVLQVGDPSLVEPLTDVLDAAWPDFAADRAKAASDHSDPSLTCWHHLDGPIVAVATWSSQDEVAALTFLPDDLSRLLGTWSEAVSRG